MAKVEKKRIGWFPVEWADKKGNKYKVTFESLDGYSFDDIRKRMSDIEKEYGDQYTKFCFETVHEYDYGIVDGFDRTYVRGWREETDEEFEARVGAKAASAAAQEARERAEYERLKKKYGDKK